MAKVITIVENNHITGVVYGTVNVPDTEIKQPQKHQQMAAKVRNVRLHQLRNHHIKQK